MSSFRKAIVGTGLSLLCLFGVSACAQDASASLGSGAVQANNTAQSNGLSSAQQDALDYSQAVKPILDKFMILRKSYNQFITGYNKGDYSSNEATNQAGDLEIQVSSISSDAQLLQVPDSMYAVHHELIQTLTDFDNSLLGIEQAALYAPVDHTRAQTEITHANTFWKNADAEFAQYLTDSENKLKQ